MRDSRAALTTQRWEVTAQYEHPLERHGRQVRRKVWRGLCKLFGFCAVPTMPMTSAANLSISHCPSQATWTERSRQGRTWHQFSKYSNSGYSWLSGLRCKWR